MTDQFFSWYAENVELLHLTCTLWHGLRHEPGQDCRHLSGTWSKSLSRGWRSFYVDEIAVNIHFSQTLLQINRINCACPPVIRHYLVIHLYHINVLSFFHLLIMCLIPHTVYTSISVMFVEACVLLTWQLGFFDLY